MEVFLETAQLNITNLISQSLNSLISNLFSSIDQNIFKVLDESYAASVQSKLQVSFVIFMKSKIMRKR